MSKDKIFNQENRVATSITKLKSVERMSVFDQEIFNRDFMVMSAFTAAFILLVTVGRGEGSLKKVLYPVFAIGMFVSMGFYLTSLF